MKERQLISKVHDFTVSKSPPLVGDDRANCPKPSKRGFALFGNIAKMLPKDDVHCAEGARKCAFYAATANNRICRS